MRRATCWRIAGGLLLVLLADAALAVYYHTVVIDHFLAESAWTNPSHMASEAPFDAGVVFFGGTRPDGLLDEDTRDRVRAAAALYHSGRVNELLAIGGARAHRSTPGSQLMIEALESEGVPAARLNRDSSSYDSVTNWEAAAAFAKRKGLHSVLLISCATHVYRLSHLVSRSRLRIGYYAAPLDNTRQRSWPRRWATAQREAIAFIALRVVPRPWYESALSRVRSAK